MVKLENAVIARVDKQSHHFEILVDPYLAWDYKHGKQINFDFLFAMEEVYSDSAKGKLASEEVLKEVFQTNDFLTIAKRIIQDGEVQLTTSQRNEMLDRRKNEIIDFIVKNAHDPKDLVPIPPQRIINALDSAKYKFTLNRKKEDEINEVLLILKKAMPISLEKITVFVEVSATYSGKVTSVLHRYDLIEEKWLSTGGLTAKISIPIGLKSKLITDLNNITHGSVIIDVLKQ